MAAIIVLLVISWTRLYGRSFVPKLILIISFTSEINAISVKPFTFPLALVEGDAATANCVAQGPKINLNFKWLKNDDLLLEDKPRTVFVTAGSVSTLIINEVSSRDVGNYTCEVSAGEELSRYSASLVINSSPKWLVEPHDVIASIGHEKIVIDCQAYGSPRPRIKWIFDQLSGSQ